MGAEKKKIGIKGKLKNAFNSTMDIFQDIVLRTVDNNYMIFDNALTVYGYSDEESCVYLKPGKKSALYCVELSQKDNLPYKLDIFRKLVESYGFEDNSKCVLFYSKSPVVVDDIEEDFCTKQSVYLFSYSKGIIEEIADVLNVKIKTPSQIFSALFDIGLVNAYYNDQKTFKLKSFLDTENIQVDEMAYLYRTIFAEGVYKAIADAENQVGVNKKRRYKVYQALGYSSIFSTSKPNLIDCFREDWRGYVAIGIELNRDRVKQYIKSCRDSARTFETDKEIKDGYEEFDSNIFPTDSSGYVVVNAVAVLDNPLVVRRVSNHLNLKFFQKSVFAKKLIYKTPLETRDVSMDYLSKTDDATRFFKSIHKDRSINPPKSRDIYGADISGNYTTYSFSESNSPHFSVIAPTRSGKTFFICKMISQSLGSTIVPNPAYIEGKLKDEEEKEGYQKQVPLAIVESCSRLGQVRVVHFDIGYSAIKWADALKEKYPREVLFYEDNINELRFGITDIKWDKRTDQPDEEDMVFSLTIISLLLELGGGVPLTANEKTQIIEAFDYLYRTKDYEGLSLRKLKQLGGYDDVIASIQREYKKEFESEKITEMSKLMDIEGLEKKFPFLTVPLPFDIKMYLDKKSKNYLTREVEKEACNTASSKLEFIISSPIFGYYSKASIKDSYYFYMELETIKTLGEAVFIPIFISMFQKLYRRDVKRAVKYKNAGKVPPKVFYIIEESHNFRKDSLRALFDVVLREAARYNIHMGFITQSGNDIDATLLYNIGTRIVLPSDKPDEQAMELRTYWSQDDQYDLTDKEERAKYVNFFKTYNRKYTAFMKYGGGLLTLKPPVSKEEAWMFNSNPVPQQSEEE